MISGGSVSTLQPLRAARSRARPGNSTAGRSLAARQTRTPPGASIDRHCSAAPGDVPRWGQAGQFLIEVEGLGALVDFGGGILSGGSFANFSAF